MKIAKTDFSPQGRDDWGGGKKVCGGDNPGIIIM